MDWPDFNTTLNVATAAEVFTFRGELADKIPISVASLALERKYIEPDNSGQQKQRFYHAPVRKTRSCRYPTELHRKLLQEQHDISLPPTTHHPRLILLCPLFTRASEDASPDALRLRSHKLRPVGDILADRASEPPSASQTSNTVAVQLRTDESMWRYPGDPFLEIPQHRLPASLQPGHQHIWSSIGQTLVRADGVLSCKTNGSDGCPKSLCVVYGGSSAQTLDQGGRLAAKDVTQDPGAFALVRRAAYRCPRVLKLCRTIFAFCALSNFVALARPSGPVYLGTSVSGTVSTLCSFVQLTTGLDWDRKDPYFITTNISLSGLSMLFSILFCAGIRQWLKGREKHVYVMLIFLTPWFCYLANRPMIQEGHHWLEGIPFFINIWAMFVAFGITVARAMLPTPSPSLPGPRGPSPELR